MKEISRAAETVFLSLPEDFRDWVTIRFAEYYLQFGSGHGFRTPRGQCWGRRIMNDWYFGNRTPLSEFAKGLFDGFKFNFDGFENLPTEGSEILVINQPNTGPLRGNWFKFLANLAIARRRNWHGNYEARWVQREISDNPILTKTPIGIQKRRLSQMIHKSCDTILVNPGGEEKNNLKALLEMRKHLINGGVLVICPEGVAGRVLQRAKRESGKLILMLSKKTKVPIRPIAVWDNGDDLNIKFGDTIDFNSLSDDSQKVADLAMTKIATLLPDERRGVYGNQFKSK